MPSSFAVLSSTAPLLTSSHAVSPRPVVPASVRHAAVPSAGASRPPLLQLARASRQLSLFDAPRVVDART